MIVKLNDVVRRTLPSVDTEFKIQAVSKSFDGAHYKIKPNQLALAGVPDLWLSIYVMDDGTVHVKAVAVDEV